MTPIERTGARLVMFLHKPDGSEGKPDELLRVGKTIAAEAAKSWHKARFAKLDRDLERYVEAFEASTRDMDAFLHGPPLRTSEHLREELDELAPIATRCIKKLKQDLLYIPCCMSPDTIC